MKQPKKPSRRQKECMSAHYLDWKKWMIVEETEFYLKIINKETGRRKTIDKYLRRRISC